MDARPALGPAEPGDDPDLPHRARRLRPARRHSLGRNPGLHPAPRPATATEQLVDCCLLPGRDLPLATFNINDYIGFVEHEGIRIGVECLVERTAARSRPPKNRTRTEGPRRTPGGCPRPRLLPVHEAGAQGRILPRAPRFDLRLYTQRRASCPAWRHCGISPATGFLKVVR
jgi:hypothetical protein